MAKCNMGFGSITKYPGSAKVGLAKVGAAGVSHDNQRAQTCTFERSGLQKHHQNSTRRPPRERRKKEIGGREKKKSKFWAVQEKGGPAEGGPGERPKNLEHNRHQQAPTGTNRHQLGTTGTN